MNTFQIENEAQKTAYKRIKSKRRQFKHNGEKQIEHPEQQKERNITPCLYITVAEGIGNGIEKIINKPARRSAKNANEKAVYLVSAHLNSL